MHEVKGFAWSHHRDCFIFPWVTWVKHSFIFIERLLNYWDLKPKRSSCVSWRVPARRHASPAAFWSSPHLSMEIRGVRQTRWMLIPTAARSREDRHGPSAETRAGWRRHVDPAVCCRQRGRSVQAHAARAHSAEVERQRITNSEHDKTHFQHFEVQTSCSHHLRLQHRAWIFC